MHASVNMGCQGKSGPGKIHEVILVFSAGCTIGMVWGGGGGLPAAKALRH